MKEEVLKKVNTWLGEHTNPYDRHFNEAAYWTMLDVKSILEDINDDQEGIINKCSRLFSRFQHYY